MMSGDMMTMGWGGMLLGPLMMVLFLGLLVALVMFLVKGMSGTGAPNAQILDGPLLLLKERLAKGEVDPVEFEARKSQLQG